MSARKIGWSLALGLLVGAAGGALGGVWIYQQAFGSAGDFAAWRALDTLQLLSDGKGHLVDPATLRAKGLAQWQRQLVEAGNMADGSTQASARTRLRAALARLGPESRRALLDEPGQSQAGAAAYPAATVAAVDRCFNATPTDDRQLSACAAAAMPARHGG